MDGWHDTGDVVSISEDGWIKIKGRVKRFAKVGGEMVSLTAAEDLACAVWPDARHAVVALADPKKGERLILVTDRQDADAAALLAHAQLIASARLRRSAVPRADHPRARDPGPGAPGRPTTSPCSGSSTPRYAGRPEASDVQHHPVGVQ